METSDINQLRDTMDTEMDLPPVVRSKYAEIGDETDSGGQDLESLKGAGGPSVHTNDLVIGRGEVKVAQDFIGSSDDKKQGIRMEMNAWREQPDDYFVKNGKFHPFLLDFDDDAYNNPALGCVEVEVGTESANVNIDAIVRANRTVRKGKAGKSSSGNNWKPQSKGYEKAMMHHLTPEQRETVRMFHMNLADPPVSRQPQGVCGIPNLGNTCYLNSVIQCLNQCWPLLPYFLQKRYMKDVNTENKQGTNGVVAHSFGDLLLSMWNRVDVFETINGLRLAVALGHEEFAKLLQQDAQELYTLLLDMLHEDVNQVTWRVSFAEVQTLNRSHEEIANETWDNHLKRNKSVIVDNFHGLIRSTLQCLMCGNESVKFEPLVHMTLPLPCDDPSVDGKKDNSCDLNKNQMVNVGTIHDEECALKDEYRFPLGTMIDSNSNGVTRDKKAQKAHDKKLLYANCPPGTKRSAGRAKPLSVAALKRIERRNSEIDITDCIREALKEEHMDNANAWQCSNCTKLREAKKKIGYWFLPKVIVMQLKRFCDSNGTGMVTRHGNVNWEKNNTMVHAPLEIDMSPFIVGPKPVKSTYKLFGVVNHSGVLHDGHYEANVYCKAVGKWFRCNDWHILPITDLSMIITQQAYVLFYMRSDEFDKPLDM